jgi:hypothetical protein
MTTIRPNGAMTPDHPDWFKFEENMMRAIAYANYFLEEHEVSLGCDGTNYLTKLTLEDFEDIDIDATLEFFKENGCTCDCQVMDKFFKERTIGLHKPDNEDSLAQLVQIPKTHSQINPTTAEGEVGAKVIFLDQHTENKVVQINDQDGNPWFLAENVCDELDIDMSQLTEMVEPEQIALINELPIISEIGFYSAIHRSHTPGALRWQNYLINEVLPYFEAVGEVPAPNKRMYGKLAALPSGMSSPASGLTAGIFPRELPGDKRIS